MDKITFEQLLSIYRALSFDPNGTQGELQIRTQELKATLEFLLQEENIDDSGLSIHHANPEMLSVGQTVRLSVSPPRLGLGILAKDMDALLAIPKAHIEERRNYFLVAERYAAKDSNPPTIIQHYRDLLAFVQLLKESAAYLEADKKELIFIHEGKFTVPVSYTAQDLLSLDSESIAKIRDSFVDDTHKEQRLAILADTLIGLLKGTPPTDRFNVLLSHLSEFYSKYADGYRLFVSNFSYDKVISELELAKVEYTGKIHKAFTDIQNQILGIPVATVVVATQMKSASQIGYEFWMNIAVLAGCWIFVMLVGLLICNQRHTLTVLGGEINRQKTLIEQEYRSVSTQFEDIFKSLNARLVHQKRVLIALGVVLIAGLLLAHIIFFCLTPIAMTWLSDIYHHGKALVIETFNAIVTLQSLS